MKKHILNVTLVKFLVRNVYSIKQQYTFDISIKILVKTRKEVSPPALDNYGQSCFVRSDFKKNEVCL